MRKLVNYFVILSLVIGQILPPNSAYAFNLFEKKSPPTFAPRGEVVPQEMGRLKKVHLTSPQYQNLYQTSGLDSAVEQIKADGHPLVILIEDAHASNEAQQNIANLIHFIRNRWNIGLLALEGAEGEAPLGMVRNIPAGQPQTDVLDFYLRQALISGPEYEALRSPDSYKVRGVENMELYEADRKIFLDVADNRREADIAIGKAQSSLEAEKQKLYSPELFAFDRKEGKFRRNTDRYFVSFIPYLVKTASQKGIRLSSDSTLARLSDVLGRAQNVSLPNLEQELTAFEKEFPQFKSETEIIKKRFLPRGFDFNFGVTGPPPQIPTVYLYRFPNINGYLKLASVRSGMPASEIFNEIESLSLKVKKSMSRSPRELVLDTRDREIEKLKRILSLEAQPADLADQKSLEKLAQELAIAEIYKKAEFFYELAKKRDETLALNTLQVVNESAPPKAAILVAGGFHTEGIQKIYENMKINFIVLSPQFNADWMNESLYRMRLRDDLSLTSSTIAARKQTFRRIFYPQYEFTVLRHIEGASVPETYSEYTKDSREAVAKTQKTLRAVEQAQNVIHVKFGVPPRKAASLGTVPDSSAGLNLRYGLKTGASLGLAEVKFFETDQSFNEAISEELLPQFRAALLELKPWPDTEKIIKVTVHREENKPTRLEKDPTELRLYTSKRSIENITEAFRGALGESASQLQETRRRFMVKSAAAVLAVGGIAGLVSSLVPRAERSDETKPKLPTDAGNFPLAEARPFLSIYYGDHANLKDADKIIAFLERSLKNNPGARAGGLKPIFIIEQLLERKSFREYAQTKGCSLEDRTAAESNTDLRRYYESRIFDPNFKRTINRINASVNSTELDRSKVKLLQYLLDNDFEIVLEQIPYETYMNYFYEDNLFQSKSFPLDDQATVLRLFREGRLSYWKSFWKKERSRDIAFHEQLKRLRLQNPRSLILTFRGSSHRFHDGLLRDGMSPSVSELRNDYQYTYDKVFQMILEGKEPSLDDLIRQYVELGIVGIIKMATLDDDDELIQKLDKSLLAKDPKALQKMIVDYVTLWFMFRNDLAKQKQELKTFLERVPGTLDGDVKAPTNPADAARVRELKALISRFEIQGEAASWVELGYRHGLLSQKDYERLNRFLDQKTETIIKTQSKSLGIFESLSISDADAKAISEELIDGLVNDRGGLQHLFAVTMREYPLLNQRTRFSNFVKKQSAVFPVLSQHIKELIRVAADNKRRPNSGIEMVIWRLVNMHYPFGLGWNILLRDFTHEDFKKLVDAQLKALDKALPLINEVTRRDKNNEIIIPAEDYFELTQSSYADNPETIRILGEKAKAFLKPQRASLGVESPEVFERKAVQLEAEYLELEKKLLGELQQYQKIAPDEKVNYSLWKAKEKSVREDLAYVRAKLTLIQARVAAQLIDADGLIHIKMPDGNQPDETIDRQYPWGLLLGKLNQRYGALQLEKDLEKMNGGELREQKKAIDEEKAILTQIYQGVMNEIYKVNLPSEERSAASLGQVEIWKGDEKVENAVLQEQIEKFVGKKITAHNVSKIVLHLKDPKQKVTYDADKKEIHFYTPKTNLEKVFQEFQDNFPTVLSQIPGLPASRRTAVTTLAAAGVGALFFFLWRGQVESHPRTQIRKETQPAGIQFDPAKHERQKFYAIFNWHGDNSDFKLLEPKLNEILSRSAPNNDRNAYPELFFIGEQALGFKHASPYLPQGLAEKVGFNKLFFDPKYKSELQAAYEQAVVYDVSKLDGYDEAPVEERAKRFVGGTNPYYRRMLEWTAKSGVYLRWEAGSFEGFYAYNQSLAFTYQDVEKFYRGDMEGFYADEIERHKKINESNAFRDSAINRQVKQILREHPDANVVLVEGSAHYANRDILFKDLQGIAHKTSELDFKDPRYILNGAYLRGLIANKFGDWNLVPESSRRDWVAKAVMDQVVSNVVPLDWSVTQTYEEINRIFEAAKKEGFGPWEALSQVSRRLSQKNISSNTDPVFVVLPELLQMGWLEEATYKQLMKKVLRGRSLGMDWKPITVSGELQGNTTVLHVGDKTIEATSKMILLGGLAEAQIDDDLLPKALVFQNAAGDQFRIGYWTKGDVKTVDSVSWKEPKNIAAALNKALDAVRSASLGQVEIWKGDEKVENAALQEQIEKFVSEQVTQGKAKNVSKVVFHLKAQEQKIAYDAAKKEIHFYTAKTNLDKAFQEFKEKFPTVLAQIPGLQVSRRAMVATLLGATGVGALVLTLKGEAFSKPKQNVQGPEKNAKGTDQKWTVIYTSHGTVQDFEKIRPLLDQSLEAAGGKKAKFTIIEESGYFSLGNLPVEIRPRLLKSDYLKDPVLREAAQKAIDKVNGTGEHNALAFRSNRVSLRYYYNHLLAERQKGTEAQLSDFQMSIFAYLADKTDQGYNIWLEWEKLHLESALDHFYWDYIEQENAVRLYREGKLEEYLANEREVVKAKVRVVRLRDEKFFGQQLPDTLKRDPDRHIITMRGSAHVGNEKWAPQELQASGVRPQTEYVLRALDNMGRMERGEEHLGLEGPEWYVEKAYFLGKPLDPKKEREFYLREAITIALAPMNPRNMDSEERFRRFAPIAWTVKPEQIEKLFAIMKDLGNVPGMSDEQVYSLVLVWFHRLNLPKDMIENLSLYPQISKQLEFYKKWAEGVIDSWEKEKKAPVKVEGKALGAASLGKYEDAQKALLDSLSSEAFLKSGAVVFDVDGTILHEEGDTLADYPVFVASLIQLLKKGVRVGIISGKSGAELKPKVLLPIHKALGEDLSPLKNLTFYSSRGAVRMDYDEDGGENFDNPYNRKTYYFTEEDMSAVQAALEEQGRDKFGLTPEEIKEWQKWYAERSKAEGREYQMPWADGQEYKPTRANPAKMPSVIIGPWYELRDGVQITVRPMPKEPRDIRLSVVAEAIKKAWGPEKSALFEFNTGGRSSLDIGLKGVAKSTALKDFIESLKLDPKQVLYFGNEFYRTLAPDGKVVAEGNDMSILQVPDVRSVAVNTERHSVVGEGLENIYWIGNTPETTHLFIDQLAHRLEQAGAQGVAAGASLGTAGVFDEKKWDENLVAYLPAATIEERLMVLFTAANWKEEPASQLSEQARLALLSKVLSVTLQRSDSEKIAQFLQEIFERSAENKNIYLPEALHFISSYLTVYSIKPQPSGQPVKVSFTVPMYKEMARMQPKTDANLSGEDFLRVKIRQLRELFGVNPNVTWQLVLVEDGEYDVNDKDLDNGSAGLAKKILLSEYLEMTQSGQVRLISVNRTIKESLKGRKGTAVISGMDLAVREGADYVFFTDADISTHVALSGLLLQSLLDGKADAAIGSRRMDKAENKAIVYNRSWKEKLSSSIFNYLVNLFLPLENTDGKKILDTQAGFKAFKREILERILPKGLSQKQFVYDFAFDTNLLIRVQNVGGKIEEVPVTWIGSPDDSKIRPIVDPYIMAKSVWKQSAFVVPRGSIATYNPEGAGKSPSTELRTGGASLGQKEVKDDLALIDNGRGEILLTLEQIEQTFVWPQILNPTNPMSSGLLKQVELVTSGFRKVSDNLVSLGAGSSSIYKDYLVIETNLIEGLLSEDVSETLSPTIETYIQKSRELLKTAMNLTVPYRSIQQSLQTEELERVQKASSELSKNHSLPQDIGEAKRIVVSRFLPDFDEEVWAFQLFGGRYERVILFVSSSGIVAEVKKSTETLPVTIPVLPIADRIAPTLLNILRDKNYQGKELSLIEVTAVYLSHFLSEAALSARQLDPSNAASEGRKLREQLLGVHRKKVAAANATKSKQALLRRNKNILTVILSKNPWLLQPNVDASSIQICCWNAVLAFGKPIEEDETIARFLSEGLSAFRGKIQTREELNEAITQILRKSKSLGEKGPDLSKNQPTSPGKVEISDKEIVKYMEILKNRVIAIEARIRERLRKEEPQLNRYEVRARVDKDPDYQRYLNWFELLQAVHQYNKDLENELLPALIQQRYRSERSQELPRAIEIIDILKAEGKTGKSLGTSTGSTIEPEENSLNDLSWNLKMRDLFFGQVGEPYFKDGPVRVVAMVVKDKAISLEEMEGLPKEDPRSGSVRIVIRHWNGEAFDTSPSAILASRDFEKTAFKGPGYNTLYTEGLSILEGISYQLNIGTDPQVALNDLSLVPPTISYSEDVSLGQIGKPSKPTAASLGEKAQISFASAGARTMYRLPDLTRQFPNLKFTLTKYALDHVARHPVTNLAAIQELGVDEPAPFILFAEGPNAQEVLGFIAKELGVQEKVFDENSRKALPEQTKPEAIFNKDKMSERLVTVQTPKRGLAYEPSLRLIELGNAVEKYFNAAVFLARTKEASQSDLIEFNSDDFQFKQFGFGIGNGVTVRLTAIGVQPQDTLEKILDLTAQLLQDPEALDGGSQGKVQTYLKAVKNLSLAVSKQASSLGTEPRLPKENLTATQQLLRLGKAVEAVSFENIQGMDLLEYARKIRREKNVKRIYFDLDLTVFRPMGYVSSSQWFHDTVDEFGIERAVRWWANMGHEDRQMTNGFFYKLSNSKLPGYIEALKNDGFEVVGITRRIGKRDHGRTRQILERLGVRFPVIAYADRDQEKLADILMECERKEGAIPALFIDDSKTNLLEVLPLRQSLYGVHYANSDIHKEDLWSYKDYLLKAHEAFVQKRYGHCLEYYFNAVVRILTLKDFAGTDSEKREQAYRVLWEIDTELSRLVAARPKGLWKLRRIVEDAKTGRSYLFHDQEARLKRPEALSRGPILLDTTMLERKILRLYSSQVLEGDPTLIQKLKRKVERTHDLVDELSDVFRLDTEEKMYLRIAALMNDLGKGYSAHKLALHFNGIDKRFLSEEDQREISAFVEDGLEILMGDRVRRKKSGQNSRPEIHVPRPAILLVKEVNGQLNPIEKEIFDSLHLDFPAFLLKLAVEYSKSVSVRPERGSYVFINSESEVEEWLKTKGANREFPPEVNEKRFRDIVEVFKAAFRHQVRSTSILDEKAGITEPPKFQEEIGKLQQFYRLSILALVPLMSMAPLMSSKAEDLDTFIRGSADDFCKKLNIYVRDNLKKKIGRRIGEIAKSEFAPGQLEFVLTTFVKNEKNQEKLVDLLSSQLFWQHHPKRLMSSIQTQIELLRAEKQMAQKSQEELMLIALTDVLTDEILAAKVVQIKSPEFKTIREQRGRILTTYGQFKYFKERYLDFQDRNLPRSPEEQKLFLNTAIQRIESFESDLKRLGEMMDDDFDHLRQYYLQLREMNQSAGRGLSEFLIVEDDPEYNWYLQLKVLRRIPPAQRDQARIYSARNPKEAYERLAEMEAICKKEGHQFKGPQVVITDRQMRVDPDDPRSKDNDAGWELARFIQSNFPETYIVLESTAWWPIKANISWASDKADGLFFESGLDLLDEDYLGRSSGRTSVRLKPVDGSSLGEERKAVVSVDRKEIVRMIDKNISENPKLLYLLMPSSQIHRIDEAAFDRVLKTPKEKIQIEILWDGDSEGRPLTSISERMEYLKKMGLEHLTSQKNFRSNFSGYEKANTLSLADQVKVRANDLIGKGIPAKQISVLKPDSSSEVFSRVLSLKGASLYSLYLMLYLIQIEGNRGADLLGIFQVDPKTGDYTALLDQELAEIFTAQFSAKAVSQAA